MRLWDRLLAVLEAHVARHPDAVERFLTAQERQAAALERLVELGEVALQVDPASLAAAAEAARPPDHRKLVIDDPDYAAYRQVEQITLDLAGTLGRIPTDEEVHEELDRREAVDRAAAAHAAAWDGPSHGQH